MIHQRSRQLAFERRVLEGAFHEIAMAVKSRAVEPLPGAWQRRSHLRRSKLEGVIDIATVQLFVKRFESRSDTVPGFQGQTQIRNDSLSVRGCSQITRDDEESTIRRTIAKCCEFHVGIIYHRHV